MVRRSVLFTPGDRPDRMRKAPGLGADVVVFDLEDAVPPDGKAEARAAVADVLADIDPVDAEVVIRINPYDDGGRADLEALAGTTPDAVMVPKVDGPATVERVAAATDGCPLFALVETASGVLSAADIASVPAVDALVFGAEDYAADVGATRTGSSDEVTYARQKVVAAAAVGDCDAIDTVYTDIDDLDGLRSATGQAIRLGYDGKMAIHPDQVEVINGAFTPDTERVEWAERVLSAKADAEGRAVFRVDGEMIDGPLVRQAETVLERADAADDR